MVTDMEGQYYDEEYFERGQDSGKNSMSGAYTWDRLGVYFRDTASHLVSCFNPRRVCDFGCAKGFLVRALRSLGVGACGVDWSVYAVSKGQEAAGGYLECADLTKPLVSALMNAIAPVDVLTCFDMLEHIPDEDVPAVFENMLRLRPRVIVMNIGLLGDEGKDSSHVNIQPREYWMEKMERYLPGYSHSPGVWTADVWWFNNPHTLFVLEAKYEDYCNK